MRCQMDPLHRPSVPWPRVACPGLSRPGLGRRPRVEPGTYAKFDTTEGSFTIRLFDKEAPKTVANFVGLAEGTKEWRDPASGEKKTAPYYDGVTFHRVIK